MYVENTSIGKQSKNLDTSGDLVITVRTCPGKKTMYGHPKQCGQQKIILSEDIC